MIMNQAAPAAIEAVRQEMASTSALHTDERVRITLQALQHLARFLSGIPGRKNVIWFSGSFPISIFPGAGVPREYQAEIQQTSDLLTPDRVAIYPVSATGLATDATYNAEYVQGPPVAEESAKRAETQIGMEALANDTGGQALYNANGLGDAIARVTNVGSHYYALAYVPPDKSTNGKYHTIHVKLLHGDYKLAYRRGYYADEAKPQSSPDHATPADPLLALMAFGLPESTQIVYKVRVQPSDPQPPANAPHAGANLDLKDPVTRYSVEYAISLSDLALKTTPDGVRHGQIEAMLVAYGLEGEPLNFVVRKFGFALEPDVYAAMKQIGLQFQQEIDVPQKDVYLRMGIYDLGSASSGTLGVPLSAAVHAAATK
jgi:hypothetical protein